MLWKNDNSQITNRMTVRAITRWKALAYRGREHLLTSQEEEQEQEQEKEEDCVIKLLNCVLGLMWNRHVSTIRNRLNSKPETADFIAGVVTSVPQNCTVCASVTDCTQILTVMAGQSTRLLLEQNFVWIVIRLDVQIPLYWKRFRLAKNNGNALHGKLCCGL
jgi:hypothetical protein